MEQETNKETQEQVKELQELLIQVKLDDESSKKEIQLIQQQLDNFLKILEKK
tara:strand:+ start:3090 stop:3245 length:156 start_codon:yes stop_codon:yes gene_type:complete